MSMMDPVTLKQAFGSFMTGVTVVTTRDVDQAPQGFTANSFTSVSLDPPLLLVCPARRLSSFEAFHRCDHFGVNVLAAGQEAISTRFASSGADRFGETDWHDGAACVPLIDGAAAQFSCATHEVIEAGDHIILLGRVIDVHAAGRSGLGYAAGRYFSLQTDGAGGV